ncbi:MAG TPA: putative toxin-antitoxin system toxin component, PIN family [Burkholderiales bacterium]|nr:putative toxin-antitoxin system toxin component, PIN family [Burkholderiales bacterium]
MIRLVLDTNVWLDWLLFGDPDVAPLKAAVAQGGAEIFMDEAGEAELARVLAYPFQNRTLDAAAQAELIALCGRIARKAEVGSRKANESWLPKCEDADDQKFLELALTCGAAFLVTRDRALLGLARHKPRPLPYRIVTPAQLAAAFRSDEVIK